MSRKRAGKISCILLIAAGFLLLSYPLISEKIHEQDQASQITSYERTQDSLDDSQIEEMLQQARAYNVRLAQTAETEDVPSEDVSVLPYDQQLRISGSSVMGIITIPCIGVELPIYHGTSDAVLSRGIGHLESSSLPVGGDSTHVVLTGHTGLNTARLFTDLSNVREGDLFYITVADRQLVYEVYDIQTVLPEETESLRIVQGEDLCTLVTCTPYGINSHRLLVTGRRTSDLEAAKVADETAGDAGVRASQWMTSYIRAGLIGIFLSICLICSVWMIRRRRRRYSEDD